MGYFQQLFYNLNQLLILLMFVMMITETKRDMPAINWNVSEAESDKPAICMDWDSSLYLLLSCFDTREFLFTLPL